MFLGVDTGGTFTDFVWVDDRRLRIHKVLSTPEAPERAILQGIAELGVPLQGLSLVHGSTVATNAALEGKGVPTVLISNRGFGDLLTIGRQARRELYQLQPDLVNPPVPAEWCLETGGRLAADGSVVEPLTEGDLEDLVAEVRRLAPRSVAINLLFSFLDEGFERRIQEALPTDLFVSRSSWVLPEYREYERGITTWLNAWLGPLVEGYLQRLARHVAPARAAVMQSSGTTIEAAQAGARAVNMLLSGPAGGLVGANFLGRVAGREHLLTFDMGGTSTDVALLDGAPALTSEGRIGPYPVGVPMVDMHTIGAGGGSIAWLDEGGLLRVGPRSAGASPGPACYGRGGRVPTVTDANLVLGRLRPDAFLGGSMDLDTGAARTALGTLVGPLGRSVEALAEGIIQVANEHMAAALRVISVQRGVDPGPYTLMSFGGAGGLHVCALAEALGLRRALVPVHAGVLSALGMLAAPRGRQLSRTLTGPLGQTPDARIEQVLASLGEQGVASLQQELGAHWPPEALRREPALDLRYQGQSYTLTLEWQGVEATEAAFHRAHRQRYGHAMEIPVELVNVRLGLKVVTEALLALELLHQDHPGEVLYRTTLFGVPGDVPVYRRGDLAPGQELLGPVVLVEPVATTWLAPGWRGEVDAYGNLLLAG